MKTWIDAIESKNTKEEIAVHLARYADGSYMSAKYAACYPVLVRQCVRAVNTINECLALFSPDETGGGLALWLMHDSPLTNYERERLRVFFFEFGRY